MDDDAELLWGVGAVADRVGVATPTLRTWERRYGIGPSRRTAGGHRRYTETDIRRVELMNRMVSGGAPAQSAARVAITLDEPGLDAALANEAASTERTGRAPVTPQESAARLVEAATALDVVGLADAARRSVAEWGVLGAWINVLRPAMEEVGRRRYDHDDHGESYRIAYETLKTELRSAVHRYAPRHLGPRPLVLASLDSEGESLGILALEAALAGRGVAVFALGFGASASELQGLLARRTPSAIFLWSTNGGGNVLAQLRPTVPTHVLLGGEGWPANPKHDANVRCERAPDPIDSVDRLFDLMRIAESEEG